MPLLTFLQSQLIVIQFFLLIRLCSPLDRILIPCFLK
nr:MAG TPA: hypothetical protein [Caudoviricetes sp.]